MESVSINDLLKGKECEQPISHEKDQKCISH